MKRISILALVVVLCSASVVARAQGDTEPKLKSLKTARILSFMPLNSPAVYYVKRPVRGTIYTALELGGMAMMGYGAYILSEITSNDQNHPLGEIANKVAVAAGVSMATMGLAMWIPPWIHTVAKTGAYVDDCNQKMLDGAKKVSFLPLIKNVDGDEAYGLAFNYRF